MTPNEETAQELVDQEQLAKEQATQDLEDFKKLSKYRANTEYAEMLKEINEEIAEIEKTIEATGEDNEIKFSQNSIKRRRKEFYDRYIDKVLNDMGKRYKEKIKEQSDAIKSHLIYKTTDDFGTSLDTPCFSSTDLLRFDIQSLVWLKGSIDDLIANLDPERPKKKDGMNPYGENFGE